MRFLRKISPTFATIYLVALYLAIGPFFAIPRTATTSFEIGIAPLLGDANLGLWLFGFTALYFVAAYLIALNPSQILNSIGRILTPVFAILIVILVVLGIVKYGSTSPLPASEAYSAGQAFGTGFIEGYNTLDALASIAFSVVSSKYLETTWFLKQKGICINYLVCWLSCSLGILSSICWFGFFRKSFSCACGCFGFRYQQGCLHSFASNTGYFWTRCTNFLSCYGYRYLLYDDGWLDCFFR